MLLYGITPVPLLEDLRDVDPTLLSPFYDNDAAFDELSWQIVAKMGMLME